MNKLPGLLIVFVLLFVHSLAADAAPASRGKKEEAGLHWGGPVTKDLRADSERVSINGIDYYQGDSGIPFVGRQLPGAVGFSRNRLIFLKAEIKFVGTFVVMRNSLIKAFGQPQQKIPLPRDSSMIDESEDPEFRIVDMVQAWEKEEFMVVHGLYPTDEGKAGYQFYIYRPLVTQKTLNKILQECGVPENAIKMGQKSRKVAQE